MQWLESNLLLSSSQFGFRKARSCSDNLSMCIFLDIFSAFDNVDPGILLHYLSDIGLPWSFCKFIYHLTSFRAISFKIAGQVLGPFHSYKGVPQGCILSPLLYILYTNQLENKLHPLSSCLQFADDVAIYSSSSSLDNCISSMQASLDNVSGYLLSRGLSIEPSKSKLVIFPANSCIFLNASDPHGGVLIHPPFLWSTELLSVVRSNMVPQPSPLKIIVF